MLFIFQGFAEFSERVKYSGRVTEGVRGNSREQSSSEFSKSELFGRDEFSR